MLDTWIFGSSANDLLAVVWVRLKEPPCSFMGKAVSPPPLTTLVSKDDSHES